ncbi:Aste57867_11463 [Aphanomyces stellatus]|uniref:Aste57867_11463 protein n=1 Tax=Aphanomyces stellatus TaxID=120398 RepID=A0A485KUX8_9STRA|nr:hypothetical protein As57867_011420 [Aphanomyces stellatus]VFT88324.1 Aste57867_11463 [Aphanomyces stellatus]
MSDDDIMERLLFGDDFMIQAVLGHDVVKQDAGDDNSSEDSLPMKDEPMDAKPSKRKRQRTTLKHEIAYLRAKQDDLQAQLDILRTQALVLEPATVWELRAKDQMQAAQRAKQENAALRTMLQDQLKTAQALERVLKKKPRLEMTPDLSAEEWREWRLDADPARRRHAMCAITDHVYAKLESEFIKHGMYDLGAGQSGISVRTQHNILWFDYMQCLTWVYPVETMAAFFWAFSCHDLLVGEGSMLATTGEAIETFESATGPLSYARTETSFSIHARRCVTEGRWLTRKYSDERTGRVVFAYRSILDDALHPHADDHLRDNFLGWVVLQPSPSDPAKTVLYYLHQSTASPSPPRDGGAADLPPVPQGELTEFLFHALRSHMQRIEDAIHGEMGGVAESVEDKSRDSMTEEKKKTRLDA